MQQVEQRLAPRQRKLNHSVQRNEWDLLTMQEAAGRLRVSAKTIYNWCQSGQLKHFKLGRTVRIPLEAITEHFQQGGQRGEA